MLKKYDISSDSDLDQDTIAFYFSLFTCSYKWSLDLHHMTWFGVSTWENIFLISFFIDNCNRSDLNLELIGIFLVFWFLVCVWGKVIIFFLKSINTHLRFSISSLFIPVLSAMITISLRQCVTNVLNVYCIAIHSTSMLQSLVL